MQEPSDLSESRPLHPQGHTIVSWGCQGEGQASQGPGGLDLRGLSWPWLCRPPGRTVHSGAAGHGHSGALGMSLVQTPLSLSSSLRASLCVPLEEGAGRPLQGWAEPEASSTQSPRHRLGHLDAREPRAEQGHHAAPAASSRRSGRVAHSAHTHTCRLCCLPSAYFGASLSCRDIATRKAQRFYLQRVAAGGVCSTSSGRDTPSARGAADWVSDVSWVPASAGPPWGLKPSSQTPAHYQP